MKKHPFRILSINISTKRGVQKTPVPTAVLIQNMGIEGDAHAWNPQKDTPQAPLHTPSENHTPHTTPPNTDAEIRQVSLLANEDIDTQRGKGLELAFGDFAENITTQGVPLSSLPLGTKLYMGSAVLEISKIGKQCHQHCAIYHTTGDCVMPKRGVFARVLQGGVISHESNCYYCL